MILWYQTIEEGREFMCLFEKFEKVEEAAETANQMPFDKFQITSSQHNKVLTGTRIKGELFWRLEGSKPPQYAPKY